MRYCIVFIIHGEIKEYFEKITTELSDRFGVRNLSLRVPAHMTLKYPFFEERISIGNIEKNIQKIIISKQACEFIVENFCNFDNKTIFISILPNKIFEESIKSCIRELGEFDEDRKFDVSTYQPHISIARNLNSKQFTDINKFLHDVKIPSMKGIFNNISILEEIGNNEGWRVKKEFQFPLL